MTNDQRGRVEAMWLKRSHRGPMDATRELRVSGDGIVGGVDRSRRRQITLIERAVWERLMRELGGSADPSMRRANVLVSGIRLPNTRGRVLGDALIQLGDAIEWETL
jgi:hypothetical protein